MKKYEVPVMEYALFLLMFLTLIFPNSLQKVKAVLWVPIVWAIWNKRKELKIDNKSVVIWIIIYLVFNLSYMLYSFFGANPDVFKFYTVTNIVSPIVYFFILIIPLQFIPEEKIDLLLEFSFSVINLFIFLTIVLYKLNILPSVVDLSIIPLKINNNFGYLNYYSSSSISLFFLLPYILSKTLLQILNNETNKWTSVNIGMSILCLINTFLFGRRALMLVFVLCLFYVFIVKWKIEKKIDRKILFASLLLIILFTVFILIGVFSDFGLRISADILTTGNNERISQIMALIDGWKNKPIFGYGIGVDAAVIRSDIPGMYEMTYFALLFQTGLVGFLIKMGLYVWVAVMLYKQIDNKIQDIFVISILGAYICLMIANSTNPYLESYDCLLYLMLPLAVIHKNLNKRREELV